MSETTNLKLFKHDNPSTNENQFDVQKALNNNWDKIDDFAGNVSNKVDGQATNIETLQDNVAKLQESQEQQDTDIEAIKAENERLREDLKAFPSGTAEGEYITLKDSADSRFNMFRVGGNSKQETREGYNEFDYDTINPYSLNTEKTNIDGLKAYKCISNNTNIWAIFYLNNVLEDGKAYTMCFDIWADKQTTFGNRNFYVNSLTRVEHNLSNITTSKQKLIANFTYKQDANTVIHIYPTTDETNNIYIANVMLLEGTLPNYEEYGATPSPEYPSEIQNVEGNINVTVCNKNFFKILNNINKDYISVNNDNTFTINGTLQQNEAFAFSNMKLKKGTYTFSLGDYSKIKNCYYNIRDLDTSEVIKNFNYSDTIVEIDKDRNIELTFVIIAGTYNNVLLTPQIEAGENKSSWIAHQEQNFLFPLAEGQRLILGDYLADDGIHHVRNQRELDGTEYWFVSGIFYYISISDKKLRYELTKGKMLCNYFKETIASNSAEAKIGEFFEAFYSAGNRNVVFNYDNGEGGVDNFKSYLSQQKQAGTPVILEYELAEEEIQAYTPEQQKAYEQIVQTAKSYRNVTNIYSPDPVSPIFSINYRKDIETLLTQQNALILEGGN